MALAGRISEQIPVPGEPGEWIKVKDLTFGELRASIEERLRKRNAYLRENLDVMTRVEEAQARIASATATEADRAEVAEAETEAAKAEADPLAAHDIDTLLRVGLAAWSYQADLDWTQLDVATARFAAIEVLRFSRQLPETKDERKNASSPSTDS